VGCPKGKNTSHSRGKTFGWREKQAADDIQVIIVFEKRAYKKEEGAGFWN